MNSHTPLCDTIHGDFELTAKQLEEIEAEKLKNSRARVRLLRIKFSHFITHIALKSLFAVCLLLKTTTNISTEGSSEKGLGKGGGGGGEGGEELL